MKYRTLSLAGLAFLGLAAFAFANHETKAALGIGGLGIFATGAVTTQRTLRDRNLSVTQALPAAGANNNSASIDLVTTTPGRDSDVEFIIELPATPSLVDAKTITITLQDSADNANFAAVADVPAQVVTGAGGVGAAALAYQFKLPIGLRRYVRINSAVLAAGGDNTAISASLSLLF